MPLYRKLLDGANDWLRKNTELQVRSCETITWMSHDVKTLCCGGSELMILSKRVAEQVQTFNVRGLRSVAVSCSFSTFAKNVMFPLCLSVSVCPLTRLFKNY